jgi:hypothetical protein
MFHRNTLPTRSSATHTDQSSEIWVPFGWLEHGVVLATIKVWPVGGAASLEVGATPNLDGVGARRRRAAMPERTIARCAASRHLTKRSEKILGSKVE